VPAARRRRRGGGGGCCDVEGARGSVPDAQLEGVRAFLGLVPLFACLPAFWALYDAEDSIWTLQRRHMDLCVRGAAGGGGWCLETEQLGVLNPVVVLLLVPTMDKLVMPALYRCRATWLHPTPLRRMVLGMQLAAVSFVLTAVVQARIDAEPEGSVSIVWQVRGWGGSRWSGWGAHTTHP
jgi:POT family proton-dependent oligopeptide transporter